MASNLDLVVQVCITAIQKPKGRGPQAQGLTGLGESQGYSRQLSMTLSQNKM